MKVLDDSGIYSIGELQAAGITHIFSGIECEGAVHEVSEYGIEVRDFTGTVKLWLTHTAFDQLVKDVEAGRAAL